ncbi:MAG TPA: class I poly(R)-hydroxyalkanoic acid synthase [Candidatus Elarobacter sp.]|jgi:polyhydroxyalkanoate synthase
MSSNNPFDPLGVGAMSMEVWRAMMATPGKLLEAQLELANAFASVAARDAEAIASADAPAGEPVIAPEPGDRRFTNPAWTANPYFDALKQGYLLAVKAVLDSIDQAEGIDDTTRRRVKFFAKQFCDAMSPTNVPWFNPEVLEETMRTGGANFRRGLENIAADQRANAGRPALVDESAFSVGKNVATTAGKVVFRNELIELIQYAPTQSQIFARPLVIVPPWINKFYILDLQAANSFVKYATDEGRNTFVVSWRNPDASLAHLTWADYLRLGPLTAMRVAAEIAGSESVDAIGYCIGGTLLATGLAYLARTNDKLVNSATFFAALVDFADPGELMSFLSNEALAYIEEQMNEQGVLSGRAMADTFNMLRANDLIWGVAVNRYLLGKDAPAFDLLYWNSDATRIPRATHSYYLREMYVANNLSKPDALEVDGVPIDLRRVELDTYCVATQDDHIAPWRSVYAMTRLFARETTFRLGASGHIAGIISPPGKKKAVWWGPPAGAPNPPEPDAWFAAAPKHEGSWWPDWTAWLAQRSPEKADAPAAEGSAKYAPLADAPGTYVLER